MKKRNMRKWSLAFAAVTGGLLVFGILAQILCELIGKTPFLTQYLSGLLLTVAAGAVVYGGAVGIRSGKRFVKAVSWILMVMMLFWIAILGLVFSIGNGNSYEEVLEKEAVRALLDLAKPFGQGESCYEYPDEILEGYDPYSLDLPRDVRDAFSERKTVEYYFRDFHGSRLLPVLSYRYGLWVMWLFAALTAAWCVTGAAAWFTLPGWREKLLYLLPYCATAVLMVYALLTATGRSQQMLFCPFSGYMPTNAAVWAPLMGMLLGLANSGRERKKEKEENEYAER